MKPETAKAIELVRQGQTKYRAAKTAGIHQSTLARALQRIAEQCPACGGTGKRNREERT